MASNESRYFHEFVEKVAYRLWEERGRALGSPEEDWLRAEQVVRHHLGSSSPNDLAVPLLSAVSLEPNEE
jgi:hypothetical protein